MTDVQLRRIIDALDRLRIAHGYAVLMTEPGMFPELAAHRMGVSRTTADRYLKLACRGVHPRVREVTGTTVGGIRPQEVGHGF